MMPTQALFLTFSFLLRIVEGVGTAMFYTASYTYLTTQYPKKKGLVVVSDLMFVAIDLLFRSEPSTDSKKDKSSEGFHQLDNAHV